MDWRIEPALALCEIGKSASYEVLAAGGSREAVVTMAGPKVLPDVRFEEIDPRKTAILSLPVETGGRMGQTRQTHRGMNLFSACLRRRF
jgi:hypothetical protein